MLDLFSLDLGHARPVGQPAAALAARHALQLLLLSSVLEGKGVTAVAMSIGESCSGSGH